MSRFKLRLCLFSSDGIFSLASSFVAVAFAALTQQDVPKNLQTKTTSSGLFLLSVPHPPIFINRLFRRFILFI